MSDLRPDSMHASESSDVPVPEFAHIVRERRSPVVMILAALAALVAAALFFLSQGGVS